MAFSPPLRRDPSKNLLLSQWFSNCGPHAMVAASPRNLLDTYVLNPTIDLLSQKLGVTPSGPLEGASRGL